MSSKYVLLVGLLVIVLWLFFFPGESLEANSDFFQVGQTIQIPYPDNVEESFSLLILQVNPTGEFFFMDPDNDVFSCYGEINERSCSSAGITCPPGTRLLAKMPKFKENLLLTCMSWSDDE